MGNYSYFSDTNTVWCGYSAYKVPWLIYRLLAFLAVLGGLLYAAIHYT